MSRRASLPGASELFRRTSSPVLVPSTTVEDAAPAGNGTGAAVENGNGHNERQLARANADRRGSGRQKHDAKITVYVSGDELLAMEHARLTLRGGHDLIVDRGRIVREAVAVLLADFDQHGEDSVLVRRLRDGGVDAEDIRN
ncbi:cobyrinic acid a,c-diamide synthase [Saccharomonospora sp. NPDC046836]|uniref:cobyrinic acid a,c-diamide synthase n=1 Tax=Saccharomonospora sp. NPDC046836 TaxID=3156921 RepID=UPI0033E87948